MTKITYNMYSYAISGMSKEMMKMDGRDSAECQNWGKKGHRCHFRILNDNGTKQRTVTFSLLKTKRCSGWGRGRAEHENGVFRERRTSFSLDFREIQQSEAFGARRKTALRGEAYAWTSDLRSFYKLHEVGVSSCLGLHFV